MAEPWDALLNTTPQSASYNPIPNPEMDQLMGFNAQEGDDATTRFFKGFQSAQFRNSPQGQQLTMEMAKNKLAMQLQAQLYQQKLELEKQFPDYKAVPTPYGAIMINPHNPSDTSTIESTPGALPAYQSKMAAEKAQSDYQASPEGVQSMKDAAQAKINLEKAQAGYMNSRPELMRTQMELNEAKAQLAAQGKPENYTEARNRAISDVLGIYVNGPTMQSGLILDAFRKDPKLQQKVRDRIDYYMQAKNPQSSDVQPQVAPDLSGLLDTSNLGQ